MALPMRRLASLVVVLAAAAWVPAAEGRSTRVLLRAASGDSPPSFPPAQPGPPPSPPFPSPKRRSRRQVDRGVSRTDDGSPLEPPSPSPTSLSPPPPPRPRPPRPPPSPVANSPLPSSGSGGSGSSSALPSPTSGGACADAPATLDFINRYRASHSAPPLAWSSRLAADSQAYAQRLAEGGCGADLQHSGQSGELLYWETGGPPLDCRFAAVDWYSEAMWYDFDTAAPYTDNVVGQQGQDFADTSHFTQLIWRSTSSVGCGIAAAGSGSGSRGRCLFVVCRFSSPGNYRSDDAFLSNVLPKAS